MTKDLAAFVDSMGPPGERAEHDDARALAAVRRLQRAQVEELRSLRSPPRIVREALGLVYALLQPSALVESVEGVSWDVLAEALDHEWLARRASELSGTAGLAGVFLAVPCVRQVIDALEAAAAAGLREGARRSPRPRGAQSPRPVSCAGAAVAQLLSLQRQGSPGGTQRCGSIICGGDETEVHDVGDVGLLAAFGGEAGFVLRDVASISPAVGVLLSWALGQVHRIRMQWLSEAESAALERVLHLQSRLCECDGPMERDPRGAPQESGGSREGGEAAEVRFARGSSLLSSLGVRPLERFLELFRARPNLQLSVEGLAEAGEARTLGLARAQAVGRHLERLGIPARRLLLVAGARQDAPLARVSVAGTLLPPSALSFSACSDALCPEAAAALEGPAGTLRAMPALLLAVEGHADSAPMWLGNAALAEGRANRVRAHLERLGVPKGQLEAAAYADTAPLVPEVRGEGSALNRRVELRVRRAETAERLRSTPFSEGSLRQLARLAAGAVLPRDDGLRRVAAEVLDSWGARWGPRVAASDVSRQSA